MDATRSERAAVAVLKVGVAAQCIGAAWKFTLTDSSLDSFALMELGWSAGAAAGVDRVQVLLLATSAVVALTRPRSLLLLVPALLFAIEAAAHGAGHERFSDLAPFAAAIRVAAPIALVLLARPTARVAAERTLRVAIAVAFVAHGLEAWARHPAFVDLLLAFELRLRALGLGIGLDERAARDLLIVIAVHDFVLAALLVARRWRAVASWMAIWGGCAALARVVQGGGVLWFEAALRACHAAAPLAVAILFARGRAERQTPSQ